ncbi:MAG: tetraacyldisaccharide 4'-kinase, partial [Alphaproteobacteria bacterium]|nr:tetraacyldisaccharide 4'-kinase [Alphaproteobacteria bacterium]
EGFGNGRVLPAGPLREPIQQGLTRADAIVLVGKPLVMRLRKPVLQARLSAAPDDDWVGKRVIAFAGIGRPQKFFQMLRALGAHVVATHAFADHHVYRIAELKQLRDHALVRGASLVTTEKDFIRLPREERQQLLYLPVRAEFEDAPALLALLNRVVPDQRGTGA